MNAASRAKAPIIVNGTVHPARLPAANGSREEPAGGARRRRRQVHPIKLAAGSKRLGSEEAGKGSVPALAGLLPFTINKETTTMSKTTRHATPKAPPRAPQTVPARSPGGPSKTAPAKVHREAGRPQVTVKK
jgi:hypothetical protein